MTKPTPTQQRILSDFADKSPRTRHTRSTMREWSANSEEMLAAGWIARGNATAGMAFYITNAGLTALAEANQ